MTNEDLVQRIDELCNLPKENEWVEFKLNRAPNTQLSNFSCPSLKDIGKYFIKDTISVLGFMKMHKLSMENLGM